MTTLDGLGQGKRNARIPSQLREATVLDPPLTEDGWLRVEVDGQKGVARECPWVPRLDVDAEAGDAAAVLESDDGNWWAVGYWPQNGQEPTAAVGEPGPAGEPGPEGPEGPAGPEGPPGADGAAYVPPAGQRWSPELSVVPGAALASGAESALLTAVHNLGIAANTGIVVGHLEDGSWAHQCQWRVVARNANSVDIRFLNHGPNAATPVLRFRLLY